MKRNTMTPSLACAAVVLGTVFTAWGAKPIGPATQAASGPVVIDRLPTSQANRQSSPLVGVAASSQPATMDVETAIAKRIPKLDMRDVAIQDVIQFLEEASGANVVVHWARLEGAAINKKTPVTLSLRDVTVEQALDAMLKMVGVEAPLDYAVKDGMLIISTADDFNMHSMLQTRVYNVSDLVDWSEEGQMRSLIESIQGAVLPESWESRGGNVGSVLSFRGLLTIRQTYRGHKAIKSLLEEIRRVNADQRTSSRPSIFTADQARQAEMKVKAVTNMKETCYDSEAFGIVALAGLRSEAGQSPQQLAKRLEELLGSTKSLGLRNAIRLNLKDLYLEMGNKDKAEEQFIMMFQENDEYLYSPEGRSAQARKQPIRGEKGSTSSLAPAK